LRRSAFGTAAVKNDDEAFFAADMSFHQTVWQLSDRGTLQNTLSTIMNPFIFMLARAYSNQTPISDRYKKHAQYLEIILTEPISKVERSVEQHFKHLGTELLSRLPSQFLAVENAMNSNSSRDVTKAN
jgi:DNA-binding GntR family transcriptional regulator